LTQTPERQARIEIDRLLQAAGCHVCGVSDVDIHAAQGVAVREFPLKVGRYATSELADRLESATPGRPTSRF